MPPRLYHRLESRTQTPLVAAMQEESGKIWGTYDTLFGAPAIRPSVDAYEGALPDAVAGVEFETEIEPDVGLPPGRARWTGPRTGVEICGDWAMITARITKNTQAARS